MSDFLTELFAGAAELFADFLVDHKLMNNRKGLLAEMVLLVLVSYIGIRYLLFDLHGMKQWPLVLGILSLIVLAAAYLARAGWVLLGAGAGYPCGFLIGWLLCSESVDPGGGRTSNLWIIWTASLLAIIALSGAWTLVRRLFR